MDLASFLAVSATTGMFFIAAFLIALMVIVFFHEYGHYKVARWCGIDIEAFSIGFGKEIAGWHDKHGTRWKLSLLPLGGYVKFKGDNNAASFPDADAVAQAKLDPGNFHGKPVWQRAAVVVAGPAANFILAIVIFALFYAVVGVTVVDPKVGEILPGSAAEQAGIEVGDTVLEIDGKAIGSFRDIQQAVYDRAEQPVTVVIDRSGSKLSLSATPKLSEQDDGMGGKLRTGLLGIRPMADAIHVETYGPVQSFTMAVDEIWLITSSSLKYVGRIFLGRENGDQLRGPAGIAQVVGYAASNGIYSFVGIIAFLSVSIGLINLFPIPMLDGGHLVYYAIEAIRGKPLGQMAQEWGFRIGFSVVIMLLLMGTWNDVLRFFGG